MIGDDHATTLMEILPPMDASDIATRDDIRTATTELRGEMTELRGELHREIGLVHREIGSVRGDIGGLRGEIGELRGAIGELHGDLRASTRHALITIIAAAVTIWLTFYVPNVL